MKSPVCITGASGFVGSHLADSILSAEPNTLVVGVDCRPAVVSNERYRHIQAKAGERSSLDALDRIDPSIVFHLGEFSRIHASFDALDRIICGNLIDSLALVKWCADSGTDLVYAGSSSEFGDVGVSSNPYTWGKTCVANFVRGMRSWQSLNASIAYLSCVFGEGQIEQGDFATVLGIFAQRHREGLALPVVSPGTQRRSFTHIDDTVAGLLCIRRSGVTGSDYALAHPDSRSVLEIAQAFGGPIDWLPARAEDRSETSIPPYLSSAAMVDLGWNPTYDVLSYVKSLVSN